ncbi:MAG: chloramphenicol acetyltransferase [Elusimicrobia bacterium HGW-Elusimicrobia-2]|nr:MAG: chloramphenicol acetyltransferase [Elusimicrobia bacterium HGW-Elusimicrobia-2]
MPVSIWFNFASEDVMKYIDIDQWKRKKHFEFFSAMDYPHFSLCADVDVGAVREYVKKDGLSFFKAILYMVTSAANAVPELRQRIRGKQVVEHDAVHPSFTMLMANEVFSYCLVEYAAGYHEFAKRTASAMDDTVKNPGIDDPGRDDLLYVTSIPWVSFTNITHPIHMHPADSVPRISWGKFQKRGEKIWMPLSLQAHHALVDGLHSGRFYKLLQDKLNKPDEVLAG